METALVEEDLLGGTCLNLGCIPTKTMLRSAEVAKLARRSEEYELLGAHAVGERGAEIVHELVLAIELGATADQIAETMHIYPTLPESINSAAGGVHKPS